MGSEDQTHTQEECPSPSLHYSNYCSAQYVSRLKARCERLERLLKAAEAGQVVAFMWVQSLLLASDAGWESREQGHDWAATCEGARQAMGNLPASSRAAMEIIAKVLAWSEQKDGAFNEFFENAVKMAAAEYRAALADEKETTT